MSNVRISQLPTAPQPITGAELVPIVQNGQTVQTTVSAITNSPSQTQTFLTVTQESTLPNSRFIGGGLGIGTSDAGAQGLFSLFLNGTSASLENASTGLIVKSGVDTVVNRSIAVATAGLSIANGNGISGNPTISLTGLALSAATLTGNGMVSLVGGSYFQNVTLTGTTNQISIANPNGGSNPTFSIANNPVLPGSAAVQIPAGATVDRPGLPVVGDIRYNTTTGRYEGYTISGWQNLGSGDGTVSYVSGTPNQITVVDNATTPTVSLANNPILPGTAAVRVPAGTTAQRSSGTNGDLRYNTDTGTFEAYANGAWGAIVSGSGVTSVATGTGLTGGPITSTGTISIANTTVTAASYGAADSVATFTVNAQGQLTAAATTLISIAPSQINATIPNSGLTNSSVTYNGVTVSLGGSGTITATATNALTIGTGLSGSSYNGSTPVTIAISNTGVTAATYGSSLVVPVFAVNAQGQITSVTNTTINAVTLTTGTISTSPSGSTDIANKAYVDSVAQGLNAKASCLYGTTGNITLSGLGTQAGGDWSSTLTAGDRILVKNQASSQFNGIYVASSTGWTRSADMDVWAEVPSSFVFIQDGTTLADTGWVTTANAGGTIDVTPMPWVQFSGAGTYLAGTGLTLTGNTFSITNTGVTAASYGSASSVATFTVNAQGQLTTAASTSIAIAASQVTSGTFASSLLSGSYTGITGVGTLTAGTWNASTIGVAYGGTGLTSYATGDLLYASGSTTLSKLTLGTTNYVLTAGASAPQYVAQSTLSVGTATNIAGGATGSIVYNSASGTTTFLALGTTNYVLTAGASAPQYVAQSTLSVGTATNLAGGAASQIPYQTGSGATSFIANGTAGQVLTSAGSGVPVWSGISGGTF